jgi:hypothetical protein
MHRCLNPNSRVAPRLIERQTERTVITLLEPDNTVGQISDVDGVLVVPVMAVYLDFQDLEIREPTCHIVFGSCSYLEL